MPVRYKGINGGSVGKGKKFHVMEKSRTIYHFGCVYPLHFYGITPVAKFSFCNNPFMARHFLNLAREYYILLILFR